MKLNKAISIARKIALNSDMKYNLGAVLFDHKNHTTGFNHISYAHNKFSIHAEEMAIIKGNRCGINFTKSTLVVVRVNNSGNFKRSYPCLSCQKLIKKFEIPLVYYIS